MIDIALTTRLAASVSVQAVCDLPYPQYIHTADKTYPGAAYQIENDRPFYTSSGRSGVRTCDITIAALARTQIEAGAAAEAIVKELEQDGLWGDVRVQACWLKDDGMGDDIISNPNTEEILIYAKVLNFTVTYVEPLA